MIIATYICIHSNGKCQAAKKGKGKTLTHTIMPTYLYKLKVTKEGRVNGQILNKNMEISVQCSNNPLYDSSVKNIIAQQMMEHYGVDVNKLGTYPSFLKAEKQ